MTAKHANPEINALYVARREAAEASNSPGWKGSDGWADLDRIETQLKVIDPDGDWLYEGDAYDGNGWQVRRPLCSCEHADVGDGESGPLMRITQADRACPLHGYDTDPAGWDEADRADAADAAYWASHPEHAADLDRQAAHEEARERTPVAWHESRSMDHWADTGRSTLDPECG